MRTVRVEVDQSLGKLASLIPLSVLAIAVGIIFNDPFAMFAGGIALVGALIAGWALIDTTKKCGGNWNWHGNNELEVYVGVCNSCDRWQIRVRGTAVAHGRGWKMFVKAVEDIALTYESSVPAIASEFRRLLARLEDDPPSPEEGFATEAET